MFLYLLISKHLPLLQLDTFHNQNSYDSFLKIILIVERKWYHINPCGDDTNNAYPIKSISLVRHINPWVWTLQKETWWEHNSHHESYENSRGKVLKWGIIHKIHRCLNHSWQSKVTAICESKDLATMDTHIFFGKLREHDSKCLP